MTATSTRIARLAMMALSLLAGGCHTVPHPFEDDRPLPHAEILTVADASMVAVDAVDGVPAEAGNRLAQGMVRALQDLEVPAMLGGGNRFSDHLRAHATAATDKPGEVSLAWTLLAADGRTLGTTEAIEPVALQAVAASPETPEARQVDSAVRRSAAQVERLLNGDPPVEHKVAMLVEVADATGAPGDGGRALRRSLAFLLKSRGVALAEGGAAGTIIVAPSVEITPPQNGHQHVRIVWLVKRPDGSVLGQIAQENDVPEHSLDQRWGDIGMAVAEAASDDVARLIDAAPPAEAPASPGAGPPAAPPPRQS